MWLYPTRYQAPGTLYIPGAWYLVPVCVYPLSLHLAAQKLPAPFSPEVLRYCIYFGGAAKVQQFVGQNKSQQQQYIYLVGAFRRDTRNEVSLPHDFFGRLFLLHVSVQCTRHM